MVGWYYVQALLAHQEKRRPGYVGGVGDFYVYAEDMSNLLHKCKTELRGVKRWKPPLKVRALQESEVPALEQRIREDGMSVKYAQRAYYHPKD